MSDPLLARTREIAEGFLSSVDERPVFPSMAFHQLVEAWIT